MLFGAGLHRLRLKSTEVIFKSSVALAELDFKITEVDLIGVARGDPPKTPIKSIKVKLKSNEMDLSLQWVSIAEESLVDHRVQLQCKVNELGGKSNEAIAKLDLSYLRVKFA